MEDIRANLVSCQSGLEVLARIWDLQMNMQLKVLVFLWRWWSVRNKTNAGEKMPTATDVCGSVMFFLKLYETQKKLTSKTQESWKPPLENIYKINSDGSFDSDKRTGGWGFVVRNVNGEVLAAGAGNIQYASSALHAEAIAAYKSIFHAAQLGMSRIILEMDATVLATTLRSTDVDRSCIGALVVQIRDIMQSEFSSCTISVYNRNCNKVADSLATHGAYVLEGGSCVYMSDVPWYVMDIVSGDLPLHRA